jgi:uncharacterized protein (TIGR03000 family)
MREGTTMSGRGTWLGCVALACWAVCAGGSRAGGIGNAMYYGPYTGGFGYSYAEAYHYVLPFNNAGFSSPWVYPNDWTSYPYRGQTYPYNNPGLRSLFKHKAPPADAVDLEPVPTGVVAAEAAAVVTVQVPADAELWFDGARTAQTGPSRSFQSPPLKTDKTYHYVVRVRWVEDGKAVEQIQVVDVRGGQQARARFPQP